MESESDELDEEFDKFLVEMKPFVLQLPHKSERQRCALWIKKLCEPAGHGTTGRKNRNMYTKLLLHMLKKSLIEGPFSHKPDPGPLPTLPDYMSIYFDEPTQTKSPRLREEGSHSLPAWVDTELIGSARTSIHSSKTRQKLFDSEFRRSSPDLTGVTSLTSHPRKSSPMNQSLSSSSSEEYARYTHKSTAVKDSVLKHLPKQLFPATGELSTSDKEIKLERRSRKTKERRFHSDLEAQHKVTTEHLLQQGGSKIRGGDSSGLTGVAPYVGNGTADPALLEREIELRTKMLEARFHEEKLTIQQCHDDAIQKILDRKNAEIEEMKIHYRTKTKDLEEKNKKLEKKVHSTTRDMAAVKETKEKQVQELRKLLGQTNQTTQNHFEKRLQEALADIEQEKFEMQKEHTKGIQEILEDTNRRLQKMETEYSEQVEKHATVIKELESRIHQLTTESEKQMKSQHNLLQEKTDEERLNTALKTELQNMTEKFVTLEKTFEQVKEDKERELRTLKGRSEATVEFLKKEHAAAMAKSTEKMREAEQHIQELKQSLQDSELNRQRQVRETEAELKQDKMYLETLHEKKVRSLQTELEQERQGFRKKLQQLEDVISNKTDEISKLKEFQKLQTQQAERTLEEFKSQVERNSGKMFDEMKEQMAKVEADLNRSKELREKQTREFSQQRLEDKRKYEKQLSVLHKSNEQEKASLTKHFQAEQLALHESHKQEMSALKEQYEKKMIEIEGSMHEHKNADSLRISDLQDTIADLKQRLQESDSLRKQEVVQLSLLKEEERQKLVRDHEIEISRLNSEKEQLRLRLQKEHSATIEKTMQETNQRLKEIEREYIYKLDRSQQREEELQKALTDLEDKAQSTKENMELQLTETVSQLEMEKNALRRKQAEYCKTLQQEANQLKEQCQKLEARLRNQELDHQEKLTQVKMEYEDKMRGMLPLSVRKQLEDTISSLKSQVNSLQQRALLLQEEIDTKAGMPPNQFTTSSPMLKS
ncbi:hypothetical protein HOLleu_17494 [Holothuria leucospilota]|uniref:DUF4485 domain-containing protein n=1 Tax=Holothuria leucospilota TaxID=206669 RepID=A0A9Q1C1R9_HOLLE|nr:hypothetical protein HOLleu_17494 [Holothuria leucospilota]